MGIQIVEPPFAWQWLAGGAGVVALILTLPQYIWGNPKIEIRLGAEKKLKDFTYWEYYIYNHPIENKWLKLLKVERLTARGVLSPCKVTDCKDKNRSYKMMAQIKDGKGRLAQRVNIPPSLIPFTVPFLIIAKSGKVKFCDNNLTELTQGGYRLAMGVTFGGGNIYQNRIFGSYRSTPVLSLD